MTETLSTFTIYDKPRDQPKHFVVRQWLIEGGGEPRPGEARLAATLEEARGSIPFGLVRLERNSNDDPCIVETWI